MEAYEYKTSLTTSERVPSVFLWLFHVGVMLPTLHISELCLFHSSFKSWVYFVLTIFKWILQVSACFQVKSLDTDTVNNSHLSCNVFSVGLPAVSGFKLKNNNNNSKAEDVHWKENRLNMLQTVFQMKLDFPFWMGLSVWYACHR